MKKVISFSLMAMLLPFMALAQFSISGTVSNETTQQRLTGASVSIGRQTSQTNTSGHFNFENLSAGTYTLKVSFLGFATYSTQINLNSNKTLQISLSPSTIVADEVIVKATRAGENDPSTFTNLTKEELDKNNLGQDLPYLLNQTPSVVVSSDAGTGIGYTGIRIRGSDPTRINVTINGIPYNDAESQGTFWVNLPDFASSVDNIQIQRGVGTSTNGAGAFGGSLNIQTTTRKDTAYAELSNSAGSFNTWKNTINAGTGLINNKFTFDGRLSRIKSDGYIDRAASNLKSYFLSGAYYGKKDLLRANVFSGSEKTYQAWNGVPEAMLSINPRYNPFTYEDQTDNYTQDHYQLLYTHTFSTKLNANAALHYTYGRGYFEEYDDDQELIKYGIDPVSLKDTTITNTNLIRRRWLDNDFYGLTYSLNYTPLNYLNFSLGGAYNEYDGRHFGQVIWAQYASNSSNFGKYYNGKGFKTDFNTFGKVDFILGKVSLYGDLQYRRIYYSISGTNRKRAPLDQNDILHFFNPKVGITYQIDRNHNVYASFAVANKEPNRDDYVNSTPATRPKSENLKDLELGYRIKQENYSVGLNGYGMFYRDQLVLTGKMNESGEYIRENVNDSYRLGVEFDGQIKLGSNFNWMATATLSSNKVKNYTEYIDDYDNESQISKSYENTNISFSPSFIGSNTFDYSPFKGAGIALLSKYVSRQFLDNTSKSNRSIPSFFVNDLRLSYNTPFKQIKNIGLTLLINNVFGEIYQSNGYTFSYIYENTFTTENYYFPQAGRSLLLSLALKF